MQKPLFWFIIGVFALASLLQNTIYSDLTPVGRLMLSGDKPPIGKCVATPLGVECRPAAIARQNPYFD